MKVRALRGVCVGVDRHLVAGDTADLDPAQVAFLVGIGAVEVVPDEPAKAEEPEQPKAAPKPDPVSSVAPEKKTGRKEK
jgi:hypothetical protein